jgi:hypothetical protein
MREPVRRHGQEKIPDSISLAAALLHQHERLISPAPFKDDRSKRVKARFKILRRIHVLEGQEEPFPP